MKYFRGDTFEKENGITKKIIQSVYETVWKRQLQFSGG